MDEMKVVYFHSELNYFFVSLKPRLKINFLKLCLNDTQSITR